MKYLPIFSLEVSHDYYTDKRCPDFVLEPTPETEQLLRNHRGIFTPLPTGVRVLMPVGADGKPLIPFDAAATFGFRLRLENTSFPLFSDLSALESLAAPLYSNNGVNPQLQLTSRTASNTERFSVRKPAAKDAFTLSGTPLSGALPSAFQVAGLGTVVAPQAYDQTAKVVTLNSQAAKIGDSFIITYPTTPSLLRGVFADVEITVDPASGGASAFQIAFKAKQARWKYYVVTAKTDNPPTLPAIEDKDKAIVFQSANLTQSPDATDGIASELIAKYPTLQTFRFLSSALIPCQQATRKSIQLQLNGEKVLDALPNPALEHYAVDVKDAKKEASLYHIVKYFTQ